MKILVIDTSTSKGVVALTEDVCLIEQCPISKARDLVPLTAALIQRNKISFNDISLIVATMGPGLFNGLRVGAMVAKTLSFTLKIPLVGISSLKAFTPEEEGPFISLIDAKQNSAFVIKGERKGKEILYTQQEGRIALPLLSSHIDAKTLLCTPDLSTFEPFFKQHRLQECLPNIEHLAQLGFTRFSMGEFNTEGKLPLAYSLDQYQVLK